MCEVMRKNKIHVVPRGEELCVVYNTYYVRERQRRDVGDHRTSIARERTAWTELSPERCWNAEGKDLW